MRMSKPRPCEHDDHYVKGCAYCVYIEEKYADWDPWEDATWD